VRLVGPTEDRLALDLFDVGWSRKRLRRRLARSLRPTDRGKERLKPPWHENPHERQWRVTDGMEGMTAVGGDKNGRARQRFAFLPIKPGEASTA
jgi:hypothetical protein